MWTYWMHDSLLLACQVHKVAWPPTNTAVVHTAVVLAVSRPRCNHLSRVGVVLSSEHL